MRRTLLGTTLLAALAVAGCRQDMHDAPRYKPLAASDLWADGRSARSLVPGTVPVGFLREDTHLYAGKVNGKLADRLPMPVDEKLLARGRDRYDIYCTPCHGAVGDGQGMVFQRGMRSPAPASFHQQRLRQAPVGHFFDVMTNGFGGMQDYARELAPQDRWAVAAYVRVLQRSQDATVADVPPAELEKLKGQGG